MFHLCFFYKNGGTSSSFAKNKFFMNTGCKSIFQINSAIILKITSQDLITYLLWKMVFVSDIHMIFMVEHIPLSGTSSTIAFHNKQCFKAQHFALLFSNLLVLKSIASSLCFSRWEWAYVPLGLLKKWFKSIFTLITQWITYSLIMFYTLIIPKIIEQ